MQRLIIGVYPISIHNIHEAKDWGARKFEKSFSKTSYLDNNGKDSGYCIPVGHFFIPLGHYLFFK